MAEFVGFSASILTITSASRAVQSLYKTIEHYEGRSLILGMLRVQLEEILSILNALEKVRDIDESLWLLFQGPIDRFKDICPDLEEAIKSFGGSEIKVGLRDWAKMEFRKRTITEFIHRIACYKSTIAIGLGIINL
jgi:hypothetical protein